MSKLFLGVDISKTSFDVALLFTNNKVKNKKFSNNAKGFSELVEWLKKHKAHNLHICMEATGIYCDALATFLFENNYPVSIVNPAQIKGFAQSELARNKTDQADSQVIARFCRAINPKLWQPKPLYIRDLQALVRRLESLQDMLRQEENRKDISSTIVQSSIESIIKQLKEQIIIVKCKIRDHINNHPDLRDKSQLLETIPGVGEATIAQVLAFIGNIEDFKNAKQVAAFVGLNPKQRQSGTSVYGRTRLSKIGNSNLRKAFYMPAVSAKRYNPVIKSFCEKLKSSGKPVMLIIGAAMRKLIHVIFGVLKSGKPFDANFAKI